MYFCIQLRGFYRGLSWPLLSYGITYSVFFGVQGNVLKRMETDKDKRTDCYFKIFLSGCAGGAAQLIPVIPTDYVKVVLQSQIPTATIETATAGKYRKSFHVEFIFRQNNLLLMGSI